MSKAYAYTGDKKKLIPAGYQFQKLHASNYKTYHQNDLFMFVISKMVLEISNVRANQQQALIEFIVANKDKPDDFWLSYQKFPNGMTLPKVHWHVTNHGRVLADAENLKLCVDNMIKREAIMKNDTLETADRDQKFKDLQNEEGGMDSFHISLELVKQIIAINDLHPLELIEIE